MRRFTCFLCVALGFAMMTAGCEFNDEPLVETPIGEVCFRGESYADGIKANEPIHLRVAPWGCFSSGCYREVISECYVRKSPWYSRQPTFTVRTTFEIGPPDQPCTLPDCGGVASTRCDLSSGLPEGTYMVKLPDLGEDGTTVTLTVPSDNFCVGDRY